MEPHELSVVMPCLNEAETLAICIEKIKRAFRENNIDGEIIIADNGSTDGSIAIAQELDAVVVAVKAKGYGNALQGGIEAATGEYVIIGDSDDSYDFREIPKLLNKLRAGSDLVMGNRFKGGIAPGAMPHLHRYLGNPVLSFLGRLFYNIPIGDFHCGLRGFSRRAYKTWNLKTSGMEYASEMVVKAALSNARITEVPVTLSPDGRSRAPHLRTWQDGWRHLLFLLIHSPRWLFMIPGLFLSIVGFLLFALTLPRTVLIGRVGFDVHTMLIGAVLSIAGIQSIALGIISRVYSLLLGTKKPTVWTDRIMASNSVNWLVFGGFTMILFGLAGFGYSFFIWEDSSFAALNPAGMLRVIVPFMLCFLLGFQSLFTGFFISMLSLRIHNAPGPVVVVEPIKHSEANGLY